MRILYILFFLVPFLSTAQFVEKKIYNIQKTNKKPKIDGVINDNVWKKIDVARLKMREHVSKILVPTG